MAKTLTLALCVAALQLACGGDDSAAIDAAAGNPDGAPGTADARSPDAAPGPDAAPLCGSELLPVSDISGTRGLAIAADGTIYYSQTAAIGRRLPGAAVENAWVSLPPGTEISALVISGDGQTLYAGSPTVSRAIYQIDTTAAAPSASELLPNPGTVAGMVLASDGALFYSDEGNDLVYRIDPVTLNRAAVTTTPLASAHGLIFQPDGTLLVSTYLAGEIWRLTLDGTGKVEAARDLMTSLDNGGFGASLGQDALGRVYVIDAKNHQLVRFDAFANPTVLVPGLSSPESLAWGRGALSCTDIYYSKTGTLGLFNGDQPGRP